MAAVEWSARAGSGARGSARRLLGTPPPSASAARRLLGWDAAGGMLKAGSGATQVLGRRPQTSVLIAAFTTHQRFHSGRSGRSASTEAHAEAVDWRLFLSTPA